MKVFGIISALFFIASAVFAAEIEEEDDVLVLTDSNFDEAVAANDVLLVEFYAPWCGHCKSLAPEYAKAAKALKANDPPIRIAKLDATAHNKVSEKYGVSGFPTLKFFKGGESSPASAKEYDGGRTADDIEKWILKRAGPAVTIIETEAELTKLQNANDVVVLAVVDKVDGEKREILEKVADADDISVFVATTKTNLHPDASKVGSVVLLKKFDEGKVVYSGEFKKPAISKWVKANNRPLVITFSQEKASQIFGGEIDVHLLVFADEGKDYFDGLLESVKVPAQTNKEKILHVVIPNSESRILDYFKLGEADLPSIVLVNMGAGMKKYPFPAKADALVESLETLKDDLLTFEQSYLDGTLKPTLKSAEPADDKEEAVKVIVGKDFEERVMKSDKDVLLEFYAPWCGHCKNLTPKYEELAENFADVDSIVIAKIDATENEIDHPKVDVKGFPTIYFFPGNDKANPVVYDGARDVKGFTEYLKQNAKKFQLNGESHGRNHDEL